MAQKNKKGQGKLRGKIMEMVKRKLKTLKAASLELGISYSQAKRIYQRYITGGDDALVHGSTGRASNNKADETTLEKAVELLREKYYDFGPTLAQEMLFERDNLKISVSTLLSVYIAWVHCSHSHRLSCIKFSIIIHDLITYLKIVNSF